MWLADISQYIREKSYGLAAIKVMEYDGATFGIIEPYGYYVVNYQSAIYLLRDANIAIKFYVRNEVVATAIVHTSLQITAGYIDTLFAYPPASASRIEKFILFKDAMPRRYSAIQLINRCLDMQIFHL